MRTIGAFLIAFICFANAAFAQSVNVDLTKIDPQLAAQILEAQKKVSTQPSPPIVDVANIKEWAGVGKEVATAVSQAIGETAKAMNVEVNEFVKTPVGEWTLWILVWKFFLKGVVYSAILFALWVITMSIGGRVAWKVFIALPEKHANGMFPFTSAEGRTVAVCFTIAVGIIWSWVMLYAAFG